MTTQVMKFTDNSVPVGNADTGNAALIFKGRFVASRKIKAREYTLVLRDSADHVDSFLTFVPFDPNASRLLSKKGNNIVVQYSLIPSSIPNFPTKRVRSLEARYDFSNK